VLPGRALVARSYAAAPWFRAVAVPADTREPIVRLERSTLDHLGLAAGASAWVLPLD
jgi:arginine/ornithine N-succinyltransferase beta subunit